MPTSVLGALSSLFGSTYAVDKQNEAIDKQIEAQRDENDKTRQYNLNLAKMQNQWNIDQYNRENAYNTPAAQMQRFKAAGLNPNLMYGQVNNTPVSIAGSLSSGAPATPADMSALGGKRSGLASMLSSLGNSLMQIPMYREQVRGMKLDNEIKDIQRTDMLRNTRADNQANDALIENWDKFIKNPVETYYQYNGHYPPNKVLSKLYEVAKDYKLAQNLSEEQRERVFYNGLNSETKKYVVSRLAAETKYSEAQAENAFTLFSQQALGVKAQTSMALKADEFFTIEKILQLGDQAVSILANGFNAVYGGKLTTVTEYLGPKGYSYTRSSSSRK